MTDQRDSQSLTVNGQPTKVFFIQMLTRDITVSDAIGDLVDNSVDAAREKIYKNSTKQSFDLFDMKYEDVVIDICVSPDEFSIKDNAGGISYEIAKNYAFRFGRPQDYNGTLGSIGQFGIGMKRSFFKIGKKIALESATLNEYFRVEIDVDEWKLDENNWDFKVLSKKDNYSSSVGYGTSIIIKELYGENKSLFINTEFLNNLKNEIEMENWFNLTKGIIIKLNGSKLYPRDLSVKEDDKIDLKIGRWEHNYKEYGNVKVRIICGIGESNKKEEGGWYVFCNDRLILNANQTSITGWSGGGRKVDGGPEYHGQYERFRGFVFFESEHPEYFPWNTAKTSINPEHQLYVAVRAKMVEMMKPVISFLNKLKTENEGLGRGSSKAPSPTEIKIDEAKNVGIQTLLTLKSENKNFAGPKIEKKTKEVKDVYTISYDISEDEFNKISKILSTRNSKEIGRKTFDYFIENEG